MRVDGESPPASWEGRKTDSLLVVLVNAIGNLKGSIELGTEINSIIINGAASY